MFRRSKVTVELSDGAKALIGQLHGDIQGLSQLMGDILAAHNRLVDMIRTDITVAVEQLEGQELHEVQVFEDEAEEKPRRFSRRVELPREMAEPNPRLATEGGETKSTPFTRASRGTQVRWLIEVLGDFEWHAPSDLAETYATDARHRRYLRNSLQTRLREMHEDQEAPMERRKSTVRGSMFEYRLIP